MISFDSLKRKKITFDVDNKIVIFLFGLGGVGSHLAYELSQIVSLSNKNIHLVFVDDEVVSEPLLMNEKYLHSDIGLLKSEVTQYRCSSAFDLNIESFSVPVTSANNILSIIEDKIGCYPIFINCDNRVHINSVIYELMSVLPDGICITSILNNSTGELSLSYKKDGVLLIDNIVTKSNLSLCPYDCSESDDFYAGHSTVSSSKALNVEAAKNLFLYLDDIICDRPISTEITTFNIDTKRTTSKYIGVPYSINDIRISEPISVDVGDKILILVVGLGGTGASVAYDVIHRLSSFNKEVVVYFIDGDIVEAGNLNRQRFIISDLNQYKSEVTANRCSSAYKVCVNASTEYIESSEDIYDFLKKHPGYFPIILGCSDSLKLRHLLCETVRNMIPIPDLPSNIVYIDAGNDIDSGQAIFTYVKDGCYITKDFFEEFPNDLEDVHTAKLVTQLSCDELMNSAPQTKGANLSAACAIYSYFDDVISGRPIYTYLTQFNNRSKLVNSKNII